MTTRIYLTRHGLSEHNLNTEVFMGRSPASRLVEEGRRQAHLLGARLAGRLKGGTLKSETLKGGDSKDDASQAEGSNHKALDRIIASSLPRTMETAEIIAEAMGIDTVEEEDAFWELSKGDWEGRMPRHDLPSDTARALAEDPYGFRYPGGESYRDATRRAAPALDRWVEMLAGQRILFVLHGDILRAVLRHMMGFPESRISDFVVHPCSLSELRRIDGTYHLVRFNDDTHLR